MELPFDDGAVQLRMAVPLTPLTLAVTPVGVPGVLLGVREFEDDEYEPVPTALIAATVNVYVMPYDKPVKE